MAFSGGSRGPSASVSEINVTPLVDVMLVLLIIFMISAPMLQSGVDIDLPLGNNELQAKEKHMILSLNAEGKAYLNGDYLQPELILDKIKAAVLTAPGQTIYLEADQQLPYGKVAEMLSQLREQGIEKVSLITEPPQTGKR